MKLKTDFQTELKKDEIQSIINKTFDFKLNIDDCEDLNEFINCQGILDFGDYFDINEIKNGNKKQFRIKPLLNYLVRRKLLKKGIYKITD